MEAGNNNHQLHDFETPKYLQPSDSLTLEKPDEDVCGHENAPEQSPRYEQLVFNFFEQHPRVPQPRTVNEEACAGRRPQSGISHYEQLELSFRRPLPKKEDIILIELIDTAKNGRPSQRAEARHELRQIFERNPNHRLREKVEEALKSGNRPDSHLLCHTENDPDERGEIFKIILSKLQDFAELLNDGNLAIWTLLFQSLEKIPGGYRKLKVMLEKKGPVFIENIKNFVASKKVKKTIAAGIVLGSVITYPLYMGLFISGTFLLSTVVVLVDKIFSGQISQTGKFGPAFSEWN